MIEHIHRNKYVGVHGVFGFIQFGLCVSLYHEFSFRLLAKKFPNIKISHYLNASVSIFSIHLTSAEGRKMNREYIGVNKSFVIFDLKNVSNCTYIALKNPFKSCPSFNHFP